MTASRIGFNQLLASRTDLARYPNRKAMEENHAQKKTAIKVKQYTKAPNLSSWCGKGDS